MKYKNCLIAKLKFYKKNQIVKNKVYHPIASMTVMLELLLGSAG